MKSKLVNRRKFIKLFSVSFLAPIGYLEVTKVLRGVAEWTADFTPPTSPDLLYYHNGQLVPTTHFSPLLDNKSHSFSIEFWTKLTVSEEKLLDEMKIYFERTKDNYKMQTIIESCIKTWHEKELPKIKNDGGWHHICFIVRGGLK